MAQRARYGWFSAAGLSLRGSRRGKLTGGDAGRRLSLEQLETRYLLAGDLLNSLAVSDVGGMDVAIPPARFDVGTSAEIGLAEGAAAPFALDQTFLLHSRAGATRIIYLDFDGHTTSGTPWNTKYNSGADFTTPAYSFEGDSSFTNAELERIQRIWERVQEDYLPFEVDVTTEDPGVDDLRRSGTGDTTWGIRVVIGGSSDDWYNSSAGGVANVGSFTSTTDYPCYVFPAQLSNGNEKYVAEAASHETGHTLGLSHDGTSAVSYYEGHGSGATGWAPIMGVAYYEELGQFSKGEYPDANETEDDLTVLTGTNRLTFRADDYGSTSATAAPLVVTSNAVSTAGLIERNTDLDYFTFTTMGATINLTISPFYRSPNLDILATLYNYAGNVVATSNPTTALNATFSRTLGAGTYYLAIDGTGKAASGSDFGYSDYGSLGDYTITGTIVEVNTPGIDIYSTGFAVTPTNLFTAGGIVNAAFSFGNRGDTASGAFDVKYYLSDDASIDPTVDLLLTLDPGSIYYDAAEASAFHVASGLAARTTQSATVSLVVPIGDVLATDGQYYIGMYLDADSNLAEASKANNRNSGDALDRQKVTYTPVISNSANISIPSSGTANAYPSNITVAGLGGKIADVNVSLFGWTHTNPDDLDILLVGPGSQSVVLLSDVGGTGNVSSLNLVLDDQATGSLPDSTQLTSGTYLPTNIGTGDTFNSPAPAGPYGSLLSVFQGLNPNGVWSLYVLDDAGSNSGSISGGWSLSITLANAAPTNPVSFALSALDEDVAAANVVGRTVASIVSSSGSTDADGNVLGIGVTSVNNSYGQWQYSTDGVSNWQDLAAVSLVAARLLPPTDYVRFVPNANFNSAVAASPQLGFKPWDQTFGTVHGVADASTISAFSKNVALMTQPVTAINDVPGFVLAQPSIVMPENSGGVTVNGFASNISAGPATATDEASQSLTFAITASGTTGSLSFAALPAIDPLTGDLSFAATANTYGIATFDVTLQDDGNGTPPNVNATAVQHFTIEVTAVNDEQVLAINNGLTVQQGAAVTITSTMLETTDVDNVPAELVYVVTAASAHGMILVSGLPVTQFSQQQINDGLVTYQNDGTSDSGDSFGFTVDDGQGALSAGTFGVTVRPLAGDYNRDQVVDAADYVLWRKALPSIVDAYSGSDGDGNGAVDENDYGVWTAHYGESLVVGSGAAAGIGSGELGAGSAMQGAAVGEPAGSAESFGSAAIVAAPEVRGLSAAVSLGFSFEQVSSIRSAPHHDVPMVRKPLSLGEGARFNADQVLASWLASRWNERRDGTASESVWESSSSDAPDCESELQLVASDKFFASLVGE